MTHGLFSGGAAFEGIIEKYVKHGVVVVTALERPPVSKGWEEAFKEGLMVYRAMRRTAATGGRHRECLDCRLDLRPPTGGMDSEDEDVEDIYYDSSEDERPAYRGENSLVGSLSDDS